MVLLITLVVSLLFFYHSKNLLLSLLVLEMFGFVLLFFLVSELHGVVSSDFVWIILFSIFVMEGVMALSGLIMLVTFSGSDYVSSSSLLKL
nr:NADH dehydrogenase subunit 4L [Brachionus falcatus]